MAYLSPQKWLFYLPVKFIYKCLGVFYWKRLYNSSFFRGFNIPACARPVGTLPSFRARCAMAARCPCSATASRIPSKPSSALPAMRTACSRVGAAASEDVQCLSQQSRSRSLDRNCSTGSEPEHSSTPLTQPLLAKTTFLIKSFIMWLCCFFVLAKLLC